MAIFITSVIGFVIIGFILLLPQWQRYKRQRLMAQPFPAAWRKILKQRVPFYHSLPTDLQLQLKQHIQVFIAEKQFIGCAGLTVTDEMRVTIAAQACLLLFNRPNYYYPKLKQILIYPSAFIVKGPQRDGAGVMHQQQRLLSGESWGLGKVILSWSDTKQGAADPSDGRNVVIHEFAHQLDQEKGMATGAPLLERSTDYQQWSKVLAAEFSQLQQQVALGEASLFDAYGATNPAEFFAVISEVFFEQPQAFFAQHKKLYQQLSRFYRINPLSWR
ncbi:zinc-dependent peptidase [Rheinheimera sp. WS51]|uniref:M90 family metallopeptidase n=1 Tax=Rheinheimera sp. WS51 TaxID=3425886 RepID=UPI003D94023A